MHPADAGVFFGQARVGVAGAGLSIVIPGRRRKRVYARLRLSMGAIPESITPDYPQPARPGLWIVRRETGKEYEVKVLCSEGIASHTGPEPCVAVREDRGEASAGERIGQPLSRERTYPGCRRRNPVGRQHARARQCKRPDGPAWSQTLACAHAPCTGTGRSHAWPFAGASGPHREGEEP